MSDPRARDGILCLGTLRRANASEVSLRFALDNPHLTSTLCGMKTRAQVDQNLKILDRPNDPELL